MVTRNLFVFRPSKDAFFRILRSRGYYVQSYGSLGYTRDLKAGYTCFKWVDDIGIHEAKVSSADDGLYLSVDGVVSFIDETEALHAGFLVACPS